MIDPVIFTITIGNFQIAIHWYGVIVATCVGISAWIVASGMRHRGENPDHVWDALVWAIPAGIVGARLWYVVNDILGGGSIYLDEPARILRIYEGGLHFYGALLFGALAVVFYAIRHKLDVWLILDSAAPSLLIGQGLARPVNFINQELYGPPTDLPWGIPIDQQHRIPPWDQMQLFPEETTRFHPTFAYEMVWNILTGVLLLWISRRYSDKVKPGSVLASWLILAGVGRFFIEWFRPDQPRVPGTAMSYTRIVSMLMALVGTVVLLVKYEVLRVPFLSPGPESYTITESAAPSSPEAAVQAE